MVARHASHSRANLRHCPFNQRQFITEPEIEIPELSFDNFIKTSREIREELTHLSSINLDYAKDLREEIEYNQALFPHPENLIKFLSTETDENKIVEPLCNLLETLDSIIQTRVNLHAGGDQSVEQERNLDLSLQRIIEEISNSILNAFFYPFAADSRDILDEIVHNLRTLTNPDSIMETLKKRNEDLVSQVPVKEPNSEAPIKKADLVVLDQARRNALLHAVELRQAA